MIHHPTVHRERIRLRAHTTAQDARRYLRELGIRFWRRAIEAGEDAPGYQTTVAAWRDLCGEAETSILAVRQGQSYWPVVRELARVRWAFLRAAFRESRP